MFITSLLPYPAQTDFDLGVHKSKELLDAGRAINLVLQSIFDLAGIHRSFVIGSKLGGLGFPNPEWIIGENALVTAGYIAESLDPQIRALVEINTLNVDDLITDLSAFLAKSIDLSPTSSSFVQETLIKISRDELMMKSKRMTENLQAASFEAWDTTLSGGIAGSKFFKECRFSSAFVRCPERFSNAEFKAAIRFRGGAPNLRCLGHIATKHGSDKCRLCKVQKETLGHIMGGCPVLHGFVMDRHDALLRLVHSELVERNPSWDVELEGRPKANVINHKPDLVATNKTTKQVIVMDLTVRNETTCENKTLAKNEK
ncbi:Uncharacterised protein r2_g3858 [Pycnogonum litorale]